MYFLVVPCRNYTHLKTDSTSLLDADKPTRSKGEREDA